jgi:hypothetical protein
LYAVVSKSRAVMVFSARRQGVHSSKRQLIVETGFARDSPQIREGVFRER